MTLLVVVNQVCAAVGVHATASIFSNINANRTMQEMLHLANETAAATAYDAGRDWTALVSHAFLPASAATPGITPDSQYFPLPNDFKRLLLTSNVRRMSTPTAHMRFVPDYDEWTERALAGQLDGRGEWIIAGRLIYIRPVLAPTDSILVLYLDKNCVALAGGGVGDVFQSDNDSFRLDERLLKLGMIWKWKALKGSPYAEDLGTYQDALTMAMGKDSPAPIIVDRMPISAHARVAYPWPVPT